MAAFWTFLRLCRLSRIADPPSSEIALRSPSHRALVVAELAIDQRIAAHFQTGVQQAGGCP
jgi:hypothetical protein